MTENYRIEKDSMGELEVPADALYGVTDLGFRLRIEAGGRLVEN